LDPGPVTLFILNWPHVLSGALAVDPAPEFC